ncbi:MAG TPA: MarR family transcriptional regulator [Acidimicrobiales bacterium]|nr:MarR family transcriptional regulator [Acidimicrobiales bacterium]
MSSDDGFERRGERERVAGEAWDAMYRLVFEREGQQRFLEACEVTGLAPGVLKTLLQLRAEDPTPMKDLSDRFRCDPSYVTSLVDALEAAGLAERRSHPTDRRVRMVVLSPAGEQAQAQVHKVIGAPPAAFAALSADELRRLRTLVRKVAKATDTDGI